MRESFKKSYKPWTCKIVSSAIASHLSIPDWWVGGGGGGGGGWGGGGDTTCSFEWKLGTCERNGLKVNSTETIRFIRDGGGWGGGGGV